MTNQPEHWLLSNDDLPPDFFENQEPPFFQPVRFEIEGETPKPSVDFQQNLNLKEGWAESSQTLHFPFGKIVRARSRRLQSLTDGGLVAERFSFTPVNFSGKIQFLTGLDFGFQNNDSIEKSIDFIEKQTDLIEVGREHEFDGATILVKNRRSKIRTAAALNFTIYQDGEEIEFLTRHEKTTGGVVCRVEISCEAMQETVVFRYAAAVFSEKMEPEALFVAAKKSVALAYKMGFHKLQIEQAGAWNRLWAGFKLEIEGDTTTQKGTRFCIFQFCKRWLGPEFLAVETTFLDSQDVFAETFLWTHADPIFLRKQLIDRHLQSVGAEEKVAFGYAVAEYLRRTDDRRFLLAHGLEVLIRVNRFWARASELGKKSTVRPLLKTCLESISQAVLVAKKSDPEAYKSLMIKLRFEEKREPRLWAAQLEAEN